ncbi:MAG: hypothetical protein RLZZ450_130 [Pseudomonadota bacterium]|jgi:NAD(P)-dependent dehydrogenase (short-subunit alcohol dehydrogenase family)
MQRFQHKVAVITGGSSGIGFATARALLREGAEVVLFATRAEGLAAAKAELGARVHTVAGDVTQASDLDRLFAFVRERLGRIDVLFVNAGIAEFVAVEEVSEQHFERLFDVNVQGAFFTMQKALPLLGPGSAVVLNTSVANRVGARRTSVYAATKAALRSFARTFSAELVPRGVRVNAVSPGPTESAIHGKYAKDMTPEQLAEMTQETMRRLPLSRLARAEEVASAVLYLASSDAAFVLGQELVVDGGISAL